ncbi:MAG TPA: hypothetical protein DHW71_02090 [Gammaproteobacteria bacterium]|nr:hypothetical protein [Gammaproteobacteria bacterium]HBF07500.1 hypothetical protein [Gammaproteobacteria bacterium]HCK91744.1 hypothetical protein [Gammaproteobacteria bacterium]|tara:strand:- start:1027 stop:2430 length:1404 start_codon:yes stop_codon:yes gene_type:complete
MTDIRINRDLVNNDLVQPLESLVAFARFFEWSKPLQVLMMQELIRLQTRLVIERGHEEAGLYGRIKQMIEQLDKDSLYAWPILIKRIEYLLAYVKKMLGHNKAQMQQGTLFVYDILHYCCSLQASKLSQLTQALYQPQKEPIAIEALIKLAWSFQSPDFQIIPNFIKNGFFLEPGLLHGQCEVLLKSVDLSDVGRLSFPALPYKSDQALLMQLSFYLYAVLKIPLLVIKQNERYDILYLKTAQKQPNTVESFIGRYLLRANQQHEIQNIAALPTFFVDNAINDTQLERLPDRLCNRSLEEVCPIFYIQAAEDLNKISMQKPFELVITRSTMSEEQLQSILNNVLLSACRVYLPARLLEKAKKNRGGFHERLGFYSEDSYDLNRFKMYQEQGVQHITLGQNWFKGLEEGSLKAANCISCLRALSQFEISFTFLNIESFSTLSRLQQFNFEYLALSAGLHEEIYAAEEL